MYYSGIFKQREIAANLKYSYPAVFHRKDEAINVLIQCVINRLRFRVRGLIQGVLIIYANSYIRALRVLLKVSSFSKK